MAQSPAGTTQKTDSRGYVATPNPLSLANEGRSSVQDSVRQVRWLWSVLH